jgi:hypothetical protein
VSERKAANLQDRSALPEPKLFFNLIPQDARFAGVTLDGCVKVTQVLQIFHPPAGAEAQNEACGR